MMLTLCLVNVLQPYIYGTKYEQRANIYINIAVSVTLYTYIFLKYKICYFIDSLCIIVVF